PADGRRIGVAPVHQARDVGEADVARLQLLMVEDAHPAVAIDFVPLEGEVHFLDAVAFGTGAEFRLRARRAAAEQDGFVSIHVCVSRVCDHTSAMSTSGRRYR